VNGSVILVGNPNVGKSALFGALTGTYVTVSNYPGTTVELSSGFARVDGQRVLVVDTPGAASFIPSSEDERVSRDILLEGGHAAIVAVGDAKNLERTLVLALQIAEMDLPFVLCLNMMDEATASGLGIDAEGLASRLGVEVVSTVAIRHEGLRHLKDALSGARKCAIRVSYPEALERAIAEMAPLLPDSPISRRSLAVMALAGDDTLAPWLGMRLSAEEIAALEAIRRRVAREWTQPVAYMVSQARVREAIRLANGSMSRPRGTVRSSLARNLERATTHPVAGVPILLAVLVACYFFVGVFGAGVLVKLLEEGLFGRFLNPWATALAERTIPWAPLRDLLVGQYGIVTMALTYSLALVLPIVGTFFLAFGVLEDSGYLPRLAVMVNKLFKRMGLNGKAVLPMVLGLGCDTMATLTTRILETPKERLIVILLLALGVPCSAQLTVVMAMLGGRSPLGFAIWAGVVLAVIFVVGKLAARVLPGHGSDFILELPPLRFPQPGNIVVKTLARIEWYLKEAVPLFVLGTLLLYVADRLRLLGILERAAEPLLSRGLGLPAATAPAFVVGFLRRDFGAAGLYQMAREGRLDPIQSVVALTTITLFIPCIANFFMMVKERGWRTALAIAAFVFPFALVVGAVLNLVLRALALPL
jgi:ferrous iron transport protein B